MAVLGFKIVTTRTPTVRRTVSAYSLKVLDPYFTYFGGGLGIVSIVIQILA